MAVVPANVITLLALFLVRYVLSDRLIFGRPVETVAPQVAPPTSSR